MASTLEENYDPVGAAGGLFAPAHIPGYGPSQQALAAWRATNRPIGGGDIDALRMPNEEQGPARPLMTLGGANPQYGEGRIPARQTYRDPRGMVDSDVLRAAAMGSPYNVEARRNAIAERLARNERIREQQQQLQQQQQLMMMGANPAMMSGYGNPGMAGQMFGQGLGQQLMNAGVLTPPPPRY